MPAVENIWKKYCPANFFDEAITENGNARTASRGLARFFSTLSANEMSHRAALAKLAIKDMGVSFTVYSEEMNHDRDWPFDIIPRAIAAKKWGVIAEGLKQRCQALNLFLDDIYNQQKIVKDGIIPADLIFKSPNFKKACLGVSPRYGAWAHVCGTDLVRNESGEFFALEDNLRVPSGVAYMLENREVTKRILPELFEDYSIDPVDDYPLQLFQTLKSLSPRSKERPVIVVLTPGIWNSAYFEHAFLAHSMGAELVEGADLFVDESDKVFMHTVRGPARVDVIYRRIDDDYLDPEVFRTDSLVGVPGLMRAWRSGKVAIANAPGTGVADDKLTYTYVPEFIKYYLGEAPIIENVETYRCTDESQRNYVLDHIHQLVVKPVNESGGYGILMGIDSDTEQHEKFRRLIKKFPRNYIAQPTINLSTAPTHINATLEPRHVDLRPFTLRGNSTWVTPGGLTRVALRKGSLVVNSSQGGGSKDTWIVNKASD
tara:strand:+ start:3183 stop:4643 length:1461 start_codon:yes stop_codon:yes gene_type:complete